MECRACSFACCGAAVGCARLGGAGMECRAFSAGAACRAPPAAPSFAPSPMFNPANVGISPGPASGALNAAAFQGIAPPNMMPADFSHHVESGLMPPGAGGIPPTPPIAPQVPPTPVHRRLRRRPARGTGIRRSLLSSHQRRKRRHRLTVRQPRRHRRVRRRLPMRATCRLRLHRRRPIPGGVAHLRLGLAASGRVRASRVAEPSSPAASNPPPTPGSPSTNPAAGSGGGVAQPAWRVRSLRRRRPSSRHPWALRAKRSGPARLELWQARLRQMQRRESDCSASSIRWPDRSRGLPGGRRSP